MVFDPGTAPDALCIVRTDPRELLGTYSPHAFVLDGYRWPSVEHYVQAQQFPNGEHFLRIQAAAHPAQATRLGRAWFKRRRRGWKTERVTYMTRAMYTKFVAHPEVAERLLATGSRPILECSAFDAFWGCGRDGRGYNHFGKLLVRIRTRLREQGRPAP